MDGCRYDTAIPRICFSWSSRYNEWQTFAFETTKDREEEEPLEGFIGPLVDRPSYPTPNKILVRSRKAAGEKVREARKIASKFGDEDSATSEISTKSLKKTKLKIKSHQNWWLI